MRLDTRFPGGSATDLAVTHERVVQFAAAKDTSLCSMWFHFRIRGAEGQAVRCNWLRTNEVLGGGSLGKAVPVYRDGSDGPWRRVDPRGCRFSAVQHVFSFVVPCRSDTTHVAYCYPYGRRELNAFLRTIRHDPRVRLRRLIDGAQPPSAGALDAQSGATGLQSRAVPLLELGAPARHGGPKKQIWIIARHHAGEVPGSFVLEGLVREALRTQAMLELADVHIVPMIDMDNVERGCYGKNSRPRDYNRDYCTAPKRPEVAAVIDAVRRWSDGHVDYYLDLHAPTPGDCSFLVPCKRTLVSNDTWRRCWAFGARLEAAAPASCPVRVADYHVSAMNWSGEDYDMTSTAFFHRAFGALAMTLETSYHRDWQGRLLRPSGWRSLGRAAARTLRECLTQEPDAPIECPEPPLPALSDWTWLHIPNKLDAHQEGAALVLESQSPDSTAFVVANALKPTRSRRSGFEYRLAGSIDEWFVCAKGADAKSGLPTGLFAARNLTPRRTDLWRRVLAPNAAHSTGQRLVLRIKGLKGRVEIRL